MGVAIDFKVIKANENLQKQHNTGTKLQQCKATDVPKTHPAKTLPSTKTLPLTWLSATNGRDWMPSTITLLLNIF
jgi:hypothetical protein